MVKYSVTKNKTHLLSGDPLDLQVLIVDKKVWDITEVTNCVNGTFYWYDSKYKTFPTSILVANGQVYQNQANHFWDNQKPQSVFIIYKDGHVDMRRISFVEELDVGNIHIALGGVGLVNKFDPSFSYSLEAEGFTGRNADVGRKTNKTVIAYNKAEDKVYLMVRPNIYHKHWLQYDLLKLCRDCGFDFAVALDGGGSTFMDANWRYVFQGENGRRINNIVGFKK